MSLIDDDLLAILACPECRSSLAADGAAGELLCTGCDLAFPVREGIPILLVDEARHRTRREESRDARAPGPAAPGPADS